MTCVTEDFHTAGEPFRIVAESPVDIPGTTVAEKRVNAGANEEIDGLRQLLCFELRGHADMYGGFVTEPDDAGADFGVLFWHKDGFSTACGHGTIALGTWALESGRVPADPSGVTDVVIDVPSGRVTAQVRTGDDGRVAAVDFVSVPSSLIASGIAVPTSRGRIEVTLVWGGAIYAVLDGDRVGVEVVREDLGELIGLGREVKAGLSGHPLTVHPDDDRLSGVYGTIIVNRLGTLPTGELHQRNVTIFADGQVDRSPCGSGTAARVAELHATGELKAGQALVHESVVGTRFVAWVLDESGSVDGDSRELEAGEHGDDGPDDGSVIPVVRGTAHKVARCAFEVDPADDLVPGFVLR